MKRRLSMFFACLLLVGPTHLPVANAAADADRASAAPATAGTATPTATVHALTAGGIPALLAPPAHGTRLIALWALDCAYCEPNLTALAALQRKHPADFQLLTLATDPINQRHAIAARLRHAGVADYPAYAYAEATPERLNFLLDPQWGGETPRVLLIRADGTRLGLSGELTPAQLRKIAPGG